MQHLVILVILSLGRLGPGSRNRWGTFFHEEPRIAESRLREFYGKPSWAGHGTWNPWLTLVGGPDHVWFYSLHFRCLSARAQVAGSARHAAFGQLRGPLCLHGPPVARAAASVRLGGSSQDGREFRNRNLVFCSQNKPMPCESKTIQRMVEWSSRLRSVSGNFLYFT